MNNLRRLLSLDDFCHVQDMVPVASTDAGMSYFLPGLPSTDTWVNGAGRVERFQVPTVLAGIDDLVRLRLAEDSFELFRQGMVQVLTHVASVETPSDGIEVSRLVTEAAGEVFPPIVETLDKLELKSAAISALPKAARTVVGMGTRVLTMLNPALFAAHIGVNAATKAVGAGTEMAVKSTGPLKKAKAEHKGAAIAKRIAVSISTVG